MDPRSLHKTLEILIELSSPDAWLVTLEFIADDSPLPKLKGGFKQSIARSLNIPSFEPTFPKLKKRFKLLDQLEDRAWPRPIRVSLFGIRDVN